MRAHVFQHVPYEGLGSIASWLERRGAAVSWTRPWDGDRVPDLADTDLVIAMGGPMSVNDEAVFPWLRAEKDTLRAAIADGRAVLGICLGAQLIASALGAAVCGNCEREIGWFDLEARPGPANTFRFPPRVSVFHWHDETFALPAGAVQLACSEACENQVFQLGERTMGLQCHLETTPASMVDIIAHSRGALHHGPFVQTEAAMRAAPASAYASINTLMAAVLDHLVDS